MDRIAGLDFGTTNSALAVLDKDGSPRLADFAQAAGRAPLFRSVLYFSPEQVDSVRRPRPESGPSAIETHLLEDDGSGRFIQSMKAWLASRLFTHTVIGRHQKFSLEELIAALVGDLRKEAETQLGPLGRRAVVGRPVHLSKPADALKDGFGLGRLERALHMAGFEEVRFVLEPVAAAWHYERRLDKDEIVLIADFGGGTSDFSLIRVGPSFAGRADRSQDVLGSAGVPVAGNAFDGRIVERLVAPQLGRGTLYKTPFGKVLEVPPSIFKLRWHELSTLRTRDTMQMLKEFHGMSLDPDRIEAFLTLVEEDLGFQLYQAVEKVKIALSKAETTTFRFVEPPIHIEREVHRHQFEAWIQPEITTLSECVDGLMDRTNIGLSDVDRVFMTGGSSFIPAVRRIFAERFGVEKIRSGEELTSVAAGLALSAARM